MVLAGGLLVKPIVFALTCSFFFVAASSNAQQPPVATSPGTSSPWPTTSDEEEARLGRLLSQERDMERRQFWLQAAGGVAVGAPQIALGVYMMGQSNSAAQAIGPGMVVGGSVDTLLGVGLLFLPTPLGALVDAYDADVRSGMPADAVVRDVETKWHDLVVAQQARRRRSGIFDLVLGIPAFTTGLVFALAKPGLAGMSPSTQYGWAGALVGFDFAIYQGVTALVSPPPVDTAFETYQMLKHGTTGVAWNLSIVPTTGGASVGVGAMF
jgi:hypothetical protein